MATRLHNHYEPWHIVTVTDVPTAGLHLDVKHPKDCDLGLDGEDCSAEYHARHFGLDGEKGTPAIGTYRVRYWWDNYEPDGDGLEVETCAPSDYHSDCGRRVADCDCRTVAVLGDVQAERFRQIAKFGEQRREDGTGGPVMQHKADEARACCEYLAKHGGADWRAVLLEEVFEAMAEDDPVKLRAELVQSAAVCVAWVEDIDSRAGAQS